MQKREKIMFLQIVLRGARSLASKPVLTDVYHERKQIVFKALVSALYKKDPGWVSSSGFSSGPALAVVNNQEMNQSRRALK